MSNLGIILRSTFFSIIIILVVPQIFRLFSKPNNSSFGSQFLNIIHSFANNPISSSIIVAILVFVSTLLAVLL